MSTQQQTNWDRNEGAREENFACVQAILSIRPKWAEDPVAIAVLQEALDKVGGRYNDLGDHTNWPDRARKAEEENEKLRADVHMANESFMFCEEQWKQRAETAERERDETRAALAEARAQNPTAAQPEKRRVVCECSDRAATYDLETLQKENETKHGQHWQRHGKIRSESPGICGGLEKWREVIDAALGAR